MAHTFYILDENGEPRPIDDILVWGNWWEQNDRAVAKSDLGDKGLVSTVFLSINHRFGGEGTPILYETMVFGGPLGGEMERYTSREAAVAGHEQMVARVLQAAGLADDSTFPE